MGVLEINGVPVEVENFLELMVPGMAGAFLVLGVMIIFLVTLAVYVYTSLAWYRIASSLKYKNSWLAWIPILNIVLFLQLGGFHWAWIFLILIPILGWLILFIMVVISTWRIFERRGFPGWFSLSLIIPKLGTILYLIAIGFVAWGEPMRKKRKK